jgi:hypothetical protein
MIISSKCVQNLNMLENLSPDILYTIQDYLGKSKFEMLFLSKYIHSCVVFWFYDNIFLDLNKYSFNEKCKCITMKEYEKKCDAWPASLKTLYLANNFDNDNKLFLPSKLEKLSLGCDFNYDISHARVIWPDNLVYLNLGEAFNYPLDNIALPQSLQILEISSKFNHSLDNIIWPQNLKMLMLGCDFNYSLENVKFPDSIVILDLGTDFNHSVDNVRWPAELEILNFSSEFNYSIKNVRWPPDLKELDLGFRFNQPVKNIPKTVEILKLSSKLDEQYYDEFIKRIPKNIKTVIYRGELNYKLPQLDKNFSINIFRKKYIYSYCNINLTSHLSSFSCVRGRATD